MLQNIIKLEYKVWQKTIDVAQSTWGLNGVKSYNLTTNNHKEQKKIDLQLSDSPFVL